MRTVFLDPAKVQGNAASICDSGLQGNKTLNYLLPPLLTVPSGYHCLFS
jgi:hypothetical protein